MADRGVSINTENQNNSEKRILGKCVKSQTHYGTSSSLSSQRHSVDTPELYLRHIITRSDTLSKVALKYGVTTNDIRSINNIWSESHICILDCLYIPLAKALPEFRTDPKQFGDILTQQELHAVRKKMLKSVSHQERLAEISQPIVEQNGMVESDRNIHDKSSSYDKTADVLSKDYFSKFDSSLAKIRTNIDRLEKSSVILNDDPGDIPHRKKTSLKNNKNWMAESLDVSDPSREPSLVFVSSQSTNNSVVQQALENHEKIEDEMFQL